LQRDHIQVSVMRLDWSRWRGLGVTGRVAPRLAHLCRRAEAGQGPALHEGANGRDTVIASLPEQRRDVLEVLLREKVARVLATAPERLDVDRPLLQLGVDSLMAVELRNWIEGELRINLPVVELMRSPSLSRLAEVLAERFQAAEETLATMPGQTDAEPAHERATTLAPLAAAPEALLERLGDLSGEEVDGLLAALLKGNLHEARR
jgi:aryl carrier-like protein